MAKNKPSADPNERPKGHRRVRFLVVLGVILVAVIAWLNGPGLRLIAPWVTMHYLQKLGIKGNFKVKGSLTSGISLSELEIIGNESLAKLQIDQVIPEYEWRELFKGRLKGLTFEGVHAELHIGEKKKDEDKPPMDLKKLVADLRNARARIVPVKLNLKDVTIVATNHGKQAFTLGSSEIAHAEGSDEISISLGVITDQTGRVWAGQKSLLHWHPDEISVEKVDPFPGVSLRNFSLLTPKDGEPALESAIHVDDAVFMLTSSPGFASAQLDLREGTLKPAETATRFGYEFPATGTLTSLSFSAEGIFPNPKAAVGNVQLLLEDAAWKDWKFPQVALDAALLSDHASLKARGAVLGTEVTVQADAPVTRSDQSFTLGNATGSVALASVPQALAELAHKVHAIDPGAVLPQSSLAGNFTLVMERNHLNAIQADAEIRVADEKSASNIYAAYRWEEAAPMAGEVTVDGLKAKVIYQPDEAIYQGTMDFEEFNSGRIEPWLSVFKVKLAGVAEMTGTWTGGGQLKAGKHRGEAAFSKAAWSKQDSLSATAVGGVEYEWPGRVQTKGLRLQSGEQIIALDASLADGFLRLENLLWKNGADSIAEGTASLPVPEDFSKWRESLTNDDRPIDVTVHSSVLSLGLLKQWVPAAAQLDPRSTGQLSLDVSGTYAQPAVDANLDLRDLRAPAKPELPPADLKVVLAVRDGMVTLDAIATASDFPAAVIKATMPFKPAEWAGDPKLLGDESFDARLDLPQLDLSRFSTLVPAAERIAGLISGNVTASGKIGKPEMKGQLALSGGTLRFKGEKFPPIEQATASVDLAMDRIVLKNLRSTVAGGSIQGEGSVAISAAGMGDMDVRIRIDHLPLKRNDYLILRANGDLRVQGPWKTASVSGTAGVVDSLFFRDIELLPIGRPFSAPSAAALPKIDAPKANEAAIPEPFRNWTLNLTARTLNPFLIRGNFATGEVTGSVAIRGTVGNPQPDGALKLRDVRATLPFSTLAVRSGTIKFTPANGFDPLIEIGGTAEPRPYQVTVYAYGRMSDPQLVLTSVPPLPDNEIMTLLATGTTTSGLEDPQAASSRALQLLIEELRRGRFRFGKQLRPVLSLLDRVDFSLAEADPYSSEQFNTATVALSDRWYVSAGMGAEGDSRVMAIWRLTFR